MKEKKSIAEINQLLVDSKKTSDLINLVTTYKIGDEDAFLFKDGSSLEYKNNEVIINKPNKEIIINLEKGDGNSSFILNIQDQSNSKTIDKSSFNSKLRTVSINESGYGLCRETDEQLFPESHRLDNEMVEKYLNEIGLNAEKMKSILIEKNNEYKNRSIFDFITDKIKDLKSDHNLKSSRRKNDM